MIESGPKIEERRVIKKETSEYAPICAFIPCFLLNFDILKKKNILNSEYLFCESL